MANRKLPGINYDAGPGLEDFEFLEEVFTEELRTRTKLILGAYRGQGGAHGIVAENDPREANQFVSSPLLVRRNTQDPTRFDVKAGYAVTPAGDFIYLGQDQLLLSAADSLTAGNRYVVFLEYVSVDDEETAKVNRYNAVVSRIRVREDAEDVVKVARFQDWNDPTQFPPERKEHTVALALLTVIEDDEGTWLGVSLDRNQLPENRPWFSPVDIEHRRLRGTGSPDVPHALSLSDLSSGDLTLYKQTLTHGMVLSRDSAYPDVPGKLCSEVIDAIREKVDLDGSVTGTMGVKYYELQRFPVRLLGVVSVNDPTREIAAYVIPHTNLLAIHGDESVGAGGSRVYYTTAQSGEPPTRTEAHDELFFKQPDSDNELIIAGGKAWTEIQPAFTDAFGEEKAKVSLGDSGPIPKKFQVVVDAEGHLLVTPQVLLCGKELEDLGSAAFDIDKVMVGRAKVRLGLTDTPMLPSMNLTVEITGETDAGSVVEDLTLTDANYDPATTGSCEEKPGNFVVSENIFTSVSSVRVKTKTNIDPSARIMLYADLDPLITDELRDACPLASVMWNGQSVCRMRDTRRVGTGLQMPSRTNEAKLASQILLASSMMRTAENGLDIAADDFRDPHFVSITQGIRLNKFSDGLRSTIAPEQAVAEGVGGVAQDLIYTQAFMLPDQDNRVVYLALLGRDVRGTFFQAGDGMQAAVEYRIGKKQANPWSAWQEMTPTQQNDQVLYSADIPDGFADNFKIQFRLKGSIAGYAAMVRVTEEIDTSHSTLAGLGEDDHTQYLLHDGSRSMSGNLDMGTHNVANVGTVDGRDVSDDGSTLDSHVGDTDNPHSVTAAQVGNGTAQWNANRLQGRDIQDSAPGDDYILVWNDSESRWEPRDAVKEHTLFLAATSMSANNWTQNNDPKFDNLSLESWTGSTGAGSSAAAMAIPFEAGDEIIEITTFWIEDGTETASMRLAWSDPTQFVGGGDGGVEILQRDTGTTGGRTTITVDTGDPELPYTVPETDGIINFSVFFPQDTSNGDIRFLGLRVKFNRRIF